mgnify:CR=1 FL=1
MDFGENKSVIFMPRENRGIFILGMCGVDFLYFMVYT